MSKKQSAGLALVVGLSLMAMGCATGRVTGGGRLAAAICNPGTQTCDTQNTQLISFSSNVSVKPDMKAKTGYVVSGHLTIQDPNSNLKFFGKPVVGGACGNLTCLPGTGLSIYQQTVFNRLISSGTAQNLLHGPVAKGGIFWSLGCYVIDNSISDLKQNTCVDGDPVYLSLIADFDGVPGPTGGDIMAVVADNTFLQGLYCSLYPTGTGCGAPKSTTAPGDSYGLFGYIANGNLNVHINDVTVQDTAYNVSMAGVQVGSVRFVTQQSQNGSNLTLSASGKDLGLFNLPLQDQYTSVTDSQNCSSQFTKVSAHGSRVINEQTSFAGGNATRTNLLTGSQSSVSTDTCSRDVLAALQNVRQQLAAGVAPTTGTVYFGAAYNVTASALTSEQVTIGGITETADKVTFQSQGPASQWSLDVLFSRNDDRTPIVLRTSTGVTATIIR